MFHGIIHYVIAIAYNEENIPDQFLAVLKDVNTDYMSSIEVMDFDINANNIIYPDIY